MTEVKFDPKPTSVEIIKKLMIEHNELAEKVKRLHAFLEKIAKEGRPDDISESHAMLLHDQLDAMQDYLECLVARIVDLTNQTEAPSSEHNLACLGDD